MTILISVVVPTYQRPASLTRCLEALLAQRFDPLAYEIIVADDAASPEIAALVGRMACHQERQGPVVRYLAAHHAHGPAAARNMGWRNAQGEIIAFTDDDCVPDENWLSEGLAALGADVAGVSGQLVTPCASKRLTDYERNASLLARAEFVTANCFYRRAAIVAVGGFDERFPVAWREDSDLAFTLLERGERLAIAPRALVVHPIRAAPWGISLRQQQRSMYNALLYRKHPALYRQRIQARPPWRYHLTLAGLFAGLLGLGRRHYGWSVAGLGLWSALTLQFCHKRLRGAALTPAHIAEMIVTSILIPPTCVFWRQVGAVRYRAKFL